VKRACAIVLTAAVWCAAASVAPARAEDAPKREVVPVAELNDGLEPLVPELAAHPYRLDEGPRQFTHRIAFSPGYGKLGAERLFTARLAYNPNSWLGYEAGIGHNPGQSVHAVLHTLNAIVRYPLPGRFQPYLTLGYGMALVFPGRSINAAPVTKTRSPRGVGSRSTSAAIWRSAPTYSTPPCSEGNAIAMALSHTTTSSKRSV
jgi:hypothetical protein